MKRHRAIEPCAFCMAAAKRENAENPVKIVKVTIDGITREVALWSDHVHANCDADVIAIAKDELANRPS